MSIRRGLTKNQIVTVKDVPEEWVDVPEWGGEVLVRGLTGSQRDKLESSLIAMKGKKQSMDMSNLRAKLAAMTIIDEETGKRMFNDQEVADLAIKSAVALQRVFDVAQRLSGFTDSDLDELTGNSEPVLNGDFGSV
jgi:hypothetical protein